MVERKTINVHAFTVHIYTIAIVLLLLLLAILGLKYWHLKWSVKNYTQSTIWMNQQEKPTGKISDYALIVGEASQYMASSDLQNYVTKLSKSLNRDIVVMDKGQKILADTVAANRGAIYSYDANGEIKLTIADGKVRSFDEKSQDYPNGITEVVAQIKNAKGDVTGAVIISNSQLFH